MLEGKRVFLRRWRESDAPALFKWARDPAVGPIAGWPPHKSERESADVIKNVFSAPEAWAICLEGGDEPVGAIELKLRGHTDMTDREDECELGYWLARPYWGRGLMSEAVGLMLERAFSELSMVTVWCGYYDGNDRSRRVQEKCGFRFIRTTRGLDVPLMGEKRTGHLMCLPKSEWQKKRERVKMKLSVIYDSKTGNTQRAAEWIAAGMNGVGGVEARAFHINAVDEQFVRESRGAVIGSPSYAALMTADMRAWLLASGGKLELAGKLGGAFATEQYTHGGGDLVIQSILTNEMVLGMLCYSGGNSRGKPVIHLGPVGVNSNAEEHNGMEKYEGYFTVYGARFAEKAKELFE